MLFPQIFHQLSHLLPSPLHILFSHPYLWLSVPQGHVPSRQQDRLPNTELPTISSRYTVFTAPKGRAGGSPLLASCPFSFFSHCPGWHFPCWDFWLLASLWTRLLLGLSLLSHCRCSTMPLQLPDLLPLTSYSYRPLGPTLPQGHGEQGLRGKQWWARHMQFLSGGDFVLNFVCRGNLFLSSHE